MVEHRGWRPVELHSHANEQIVWMLTACERGLPVEVELLLMA
jgi:hypothetical protein